MALGPAVAVDTTAFLLYGNLIIYLFLELMAATKSHLEPPPSGLEGQN